jgi:phosphopentomutase
MHRGRRAIVLVIDACGVGALPDARDYRDEGVNTLLHVSEDVGGLRLGCLAELGLGCILPLAGVAPSEHPAIHGRLHALGPGKDSTAGHWELMGKVLARPLQTYPQGLPGPLLCRLCEAMGHEVICNAPSNGIAAIEQFGEQHLLDGKLILYTSTDSVVQLAAHVDRLSEAELYAACEAAREALSGEHAVGRVIARPFTGSAGAFTRTEGRRDFTLSPGRTYLQELHGRGAQVHGVGKVSDLFAGEGISQSHPGATNDAALASTGQLLRQVDEGLIFVNLIETDQVYGHRKDVQGFHAALRAIDAALSGWLALLGKRDLLIVTADHGVDPRHPSGDHTREYAPLLALAGEMLSGVRRPLLTSAHARHDGPLCDVGASVHLWLCGERAPGLPGTPFVEIDA